MHYEHNYLKAVVLRLDFEAIAQLQQNTRVDVKPEFSGRIEPIFPVVRGQPTASLSVNVGPMGSGIAQQITGVQWHHRKVADGTQVVVLDPEFLSLEYGNNDFDHYPAFRDEFAAVLSSFRAEYDVAVFTRIGLRYVNEISLPEGNPLDWDGLITPSLIQAVKASKQANMDLVRSMHQIQVQRNDCRMVFSYGLQNPDFPNALVRRVFVLDYDCSRLGVPMNETENVVNELNTFCEGMFEESIQDGLREKMVIIDD